MNPSSQMTQQQDNLSTNESHCYPLNSLELKHMKIEGLQEMIVEKTIIGRIGHSKLDKQLNLHVFFEDQEQNLNESNYQDLDKKSGNRFRSGSQMSSSQRLHDLQFAQEHLTTKKKSSTVIFKVSINQGREFLESVHHSNSFMNMLKVEAEQFQIDFHTRSIDDLSHSQLIFQFLKCCRSSKEKKSFVCNVTHSLGRDIVIKGQCSKISTSQSSDKTSLSDFDQSNTDQSFSSTSNQSIFYLVEISPIDNQFLMNPNLSNRRKELLTQKFRKITEQEKLFLNTIKQFQSTLDKNLEKQLSREYKTCSFRYIKSKK